MIDELVVPEWVGLLRRMAGRHFRQAALRNGPIESAVSTPSAVVPLAPSALGVVPLVAALSSADVATSLMGLSESSAVELLTAATQAHEVQAALTDPSESLTAEQQLRSAPPVGAPIAEVAPDEVVVEQSSPTLQFFRPVRVRSIASLATVAFPQRQEQLDRQLAATARAMAATAATASCIEAAASSSFRDMPEAKTPQPADGPGDDDGMRSADVAARSAVAVTATSPDPDADAERSGGGSLGEAAGAAEMGPATDADQPAAEQVGLESIMEPVEPTASVLQEASHGGVEEAAGEASELAAIEAELGHVPEPVASEFDEASAMRAIEAERPQAEAGEAFEPQVESQVATTETSAADQLSAPDAERATESEKESDAPNADDRAELASDVPATPSDDGGPASETSPVETRLVETPPVGEPSASELPASGSSAPAPSADSPSLADAPSGDASPSSATTQEADLAATAMKTAAATVLAPAVRDEYNRTNLNFRRPMPRPKVRGRVIDFHCHLLARRHAEDWFEAADHYGMHDFVTMTQLEEAVLLARDWGHRLRFIAVAQWSDPSPQWVDNWLTRIEGFYNLGSRIAKFHASPGTMAMRGHRLDEPVYKPLLAEVKARGMAIMTHIGDPDTWYRGRYADAAKFGTREEHYRMWEGLLQEHSGHTWIGAHLGGNPEDLPRLQRLLDTYPDLWLDCSATRWMVREVSVQREPAREFFIRNADRILFGSDQVSGDDRHFDFLASRIWCHRKLWETAYIGPSPIIDPDLPKEEQPVIHGLALPDAVLQKIYHDNPTRLLAKVGMSFDSSK